jgi:hypothetical protein
VLLFYLVRVQLCEYGIVPELLVCLPVFAKFPELLEGQDLLLAGVDERKLAQGHLEVGLLGVDLDHALGQLSKGLIDLVNRLVVLVFLLPEQVLFEFFDLVLNFIEFLGEGPCLQEQLLLDLVSLRLEGHFLAVNRGLDLVGLLVCLPHVLDIFLGDVDERLLVEHHEPINQVQVRVDHFRPLNVLLILQVPLRDHQFR